MRIIIDIPDDVYRVLKEDIYPIPDTERLALVFKTLVKKGVPLPKCNQCKYYEGVHNVQGHAPCEYHKIGGVLWNWYCSQFKADKEVSE